MVERLTCVATCLGCTSPSNRNEMTTRRENFTTRANSQGFLDLEMRTPEEQLMEGIMKETSRETWMHRLTNIDCFESA